jgi:integrase
LPAAGCQGGQLPAYEPVTYPVHLMGDNVRMAQPLDTTRERRADMPTFGSWVVKYLEGPAKMRKGASERDPSLLRPAVQAWGHRRLDRIKRSDCEGLLQSMVRFNVAFGTAWLRCSRTRLLFELAVGSGLLTENPWSGVTLPKPTRKGRVLTCAEESELTRTLGPAWGRLVTVAVGTGLRTCELMNITPAHRIGGTLMLTADMTPDGHARAIPLRPAVAKALDEQAPHDVSGRYWPYEPSVPIAVLRLMVVRLGWQRLTLRDLRRTFGTRCAAAGIPRSQLQAIMGHSSPKSTAAYYAHPGEKPGG